jgi:3-oxoacyl-[acyl-carrier protein] reductase
MAANEGGATMNLQGAKALVTGGSEGIGRAIAEGLVAAGSDVVITARREGPLRATADAVGCGWIRADVAVEADCVRTMEEFLRLHGRIDILVNNAGIGHFAPLVEMDAAAFERVWRVNVMGAMLMAREAARQFTRQNSGNIVNIGSTSGLRGDAKSTAYSSTKFALRSLSECWRAELRRHNVRVIHMNPSEVVTGFGGRTDVAEQPRKLRPREIADPVIAALQMDDRGFIPELSVFATNPQ